MAAAAGGGAASRRGPRNLIQRGPKGWQAKAPAPLGWQAKAPAPPELGIFLAGARSRTLLLAFAAGSRRLARGAGAALHLGRQLGNRDLAGSGRLSGHERLRFVDLLVLG